MRLDMQFFERLVGGIKRIALRAESGIAQAGAALFKRGALLTVCKTWAPITHFGAAFTLRAIRLKLVVGALAWAAGFAARLATRFA